MTNDTLREKIEALTVYSCHGWDIRRGDMKPNREGEGEWLDRDSVLHLVATPSHATEAVERFDPHADFSAMSQNPDGRYVRYADFDALRAENERKTRLLEVLSVDLNEHKNELQAAEAERDRLQAELARRQWQPMDTAPTDGTNCILAIQSGPFVYAVQGMFHQREWHNAMDSKAEPLCWMPNALIPDEFLPWTDAFAALTQTERTGETG